MAELPLDQAIPRFKGNEDRFDRFANGGDTLTWLTSGGNTLPSIAKFLKDKDTQIVSAGNSMLAQVSTIRDQVVALEADTENWANQVINSNILALAADVTALKAIDTTLRKFAFLNSGTRSGNFIWRTGNFSTQIAADTTGAVYIKANAIAATAGAWVRDFDGLFISAEWTGRNVQAAIDLAATLGISTVALQGTYTVTAPVRMRPGVMLWAMPGAGTIQRANSTVMTPLVDWSQYTASKAGLDGIIVDGNRANNTDNLDQTTLLLSGTIDDAFVRRSQVINSTGYGVLGMELRGFVFEDNVVDNCNTCGVYLKATTRVDQNRCVVQRNRISRFGQHGIVTWNMQGDRIIDNDCWGYSQRSTVSISGATINFTSGTNFANVKVGEFVIGIHSGGYFEALVIGKPSNTQLTVKNAIGTYSNVPTVIGNGDVISISGSRDELIQGNNVYGGASLGISLFATSDSSCDRCRVYDNMATLTMASGFSLQVAAGGNYVRDNSFIGNFAIDTGLGGNAMDANYRTGMSAICSGFGLRNLVDNNTWISYGVGMVDGLRVDNSQNGVLVGQNKNVGVPDNIPGAAVVSLTGWGTGATVTELACDGETISFAVNTTANAPSANPSINISHFVMPIRKKRPTIDMVYTSANIIPMLSFFPDPDYSSSFLAIGTPSPSSLYRFVVRL